MAIREDKQVIDGHIVTIRYKSGLRNITLRLNQAGDIVISAPPRASLSHIEALLQNNAGWLAKQQSKFSTKKQMPQDGAYLFGTWYATELLYEPTKPSGCYLDGNILVVNPMEDRANWTSANVKLFTRFIKKTAGAYLPGRLEYWAKQMSLTYTSLTLREQVSRWGSCSSRGSINLNWRLVHAPLPVIDYVLIHELAHRKHLDHSQRFWNLVEQYDPEHKKHRGWLKREGFWLVEAK